MSEYGNFTFFTILFVAVWIVLNSVCQVSIKTGVLQLKEIQDPMKIFEKSNIPNIVTNKYIVLGFILYLISTVFWFGALTKLDISVLSPMGSLIFIMTALMALVFLNEKISPMRWGAIFIIVIGVYLLMRS